MISAKNKAILFAGLLALIPTISSCSDDSPQNEIDYLLNQSSLPIGEDINDMVSEGNLKYVGEDSKKNIYSAANDGALINDGHGTLFYFKDQKNIGFRTSKMEYGYDIFRHYIGSPAYNYQYGNKNGLFNVLKDRGWSCAEFSDEDHATIENGNESFSWYKFDFKELKTLNLYIAINQKDSLHKIGIIDICLE